MVAAMEKLSVGAGVALALACDWRVLADDAYLYPYHHPRWHRLQREGRLPSEGLGLAIFRNGIDAVAGGTLPFTKS